MGSCCSTQKKVLRLTSQEKAFVMNSFKLVSHDKTFINSDDLKDAWGYLVDPEFVIYVRNGCSHKSRHGRIKPEAFIKHFYIVVKGSVPEKALYIGWSILQGTKKYVLTAALIDFVRSIVRSYLFMINHEKSRESESWEDLGISTDQSDVQIYLQYAIKDIKNFHAVSEDQIERWLYQEPLLLQIWKDVVFYLYSHLNHIKLPGYEDCRTLPFCSIPEGYGPINSILTFGKVMFINDGLPNQYRYKWTPLFNSKLDGENFSTLIAKITNKGPTVLVIQDSSDYVFGGFAPASWSVGPHFHGDSTTFLFTLQPQMDRYISTSYNKHYQYLNINQKTTPNGLGMGGYFEYWGLFLHQEYGRGSTSVGCTTFMDYSQMSAEVSFKLQHLEVWSVDDSRMSIY